MNKSVQKNKKLLVCEMNVPIAKPSNGNTGGGSKSCLLKLKSVPYENTKTKSLKQAPCYHFKGVLGAIRHAVMDECISKGIEICHTTTKTEDKSGNKLLPKGFHVLGECKEKGKSCIVHEIFGSMRQEGLISVKSPPIVYIKDENYKLLKNIDYQVVHLATEQRVCLTYDRKPAQDFSERYISGTITFEVNVSKCSPEQIGLLAAAILNMERVAGGYNSGYSYTEILSVDLIEQTIYKRLVWNKKQGKNMVEKNKEQDVKRKLLSDALKAWKEYQG